MRVGAAPRRLLLALSLLLGACAFERIRNPTKFRACLQPCDEAANLAVKLAGHVDHLAGARSYLAPERLKQAATYIKTELRGVRGGSFDVYSYTMADLGSPTMAKLHRRACKRKCLVDWEAALADTKRQEFESIELTIPGTRGGGAGRALVVGAHYDSDACESGGCNPGADDNATGVAALIELAKRVAAAQPQRTVRFVAFTNEEEPFFWTEAMGSRQYLASFHKRHPDEEIAHMLSIEMIGYYHEERERPVVPWYAGCFDIPDTADFVAFVGNRASRKLVRESVCYFQRGVSFPAEGISAWGFIEGVGWSDHWSFWQDGIPAVMATDTAAFRNHCYHRPCDTAARLDFDRMARVVLGLENVILSLARDDPPPCDLNATPPPPLRCAASRQPGEAVRSPGQEESE